MPAARLAPLPDLFTTYEPLPGAYDEAFDLHGRPRPGQGGALDALASFTPEAFAEQQRLAELALLNQGVTFSVYSDDRGSEKSSRSAWCRGSSPPTTGRGWSAA
ncbi:MAG: hypothetical protein QM767_24585 [Anaeromyxobacter sp.]